MSTVSQKGSLKVRLEGHGTAMLRPSDHIATGGEGAIYRLGDRVVKIYLDPEKMRKRGLPEKIKILSRLQHPYVIAPTGLVTSDTGDALGYYMPYVEDPPVGHPLSRVFTTEFWKTEGFGADQASKLVDRMRDTVSFAHANGAILVDPNELNWLAVSVKADPQPRIVDVDSWAIGRWPATAIMPSIRDWHSSSFDVRTDWFAWAIVTFQVYTGIHPYKGMLDGYERRDMERRMKENASVFTSGVRLNHAVRDFACIPARLLSWYEGVFQNGDRSNPPSPFDVGKAASVTARILRAVTLGKTGMLVFEKVLGYANDPIIRLFPCGVALLSSGSLIDLQIKRKIVANQSIRCEVMKTGRGWLVGDVVGGMVQFAHIAENDLQVEPLLFHFQAHRLIGHANRLFMVTDAGLTEAIFTFLGKPIVSAGQSWGIMVNATKWFAGVGVMDAMGAKFIIAPFSDASVAQIRVRELDGIQVVAAKAGNRFIALISVDHNGDYQKIELTFDKEYRTYAVWTGTVDSPDLNVAILPKGVCATIVRDGELDIFVPTTGKVTKIQDDDIATDMLLSNWGDQVMYTHNGDLWSVRMK